MERSELSTIKSRILKVTLALLLFAALSTCYYDNEENLNPDLSNNCDLTNVTYTLTVRPILQSYCLSCHSASAASGSGGGVRLENYTDLKTYVTNGKLYGSVTHAAGFSAMPKGGSTLDNCTIQKLKKWMDDGALNN